VKVRLVGGEEVVKRVDGVGQCLFLAVEHTLVPVSAASLLRIAPRVQNSRVAHTTVC
jgi:hypothetical protein